LPTDGIVEENAKTASEEGTSRDLTRAGNPERRRQGEKMVTGSKVSNKMGQRVMTKLLFADNHAIAFEIAVAFVMW